MLLVGEWLVGEDGIARPVLRSKVLAADGNYVPERFLVDTGADQTVFSAGLCSQLQLQLQPLPAPTGIGLRGIGGSEGFVIVQTTVEFSRTEGGPVHFRGEFPAFIDIAATNIVFSETTFFVTSMSSSARGEMRFF